MSLLDGSTLENEFRPGLWRFQAESTEFRIQADIRCRPEDLIEAPYVDPDGSACFCVHTELADSQIRVWVRKNSSWIELNRLSARRATHVEWGDSHVHHEVIKKVSIVDRRPGA